MSTNLCIDWGNTLVKTGVFASGALLASESFPASEFYTRLETLVRGHQPDCVILGSVTRERERPMMALREHFRQVVFLDSRTPLPVMNAYHTPETLGVDRLALVTAAQHLYPGQNNIVISLGTCITYNVLMKTKAFRGGAISPGLHMRLQAMHDQTQALPLVSPDGEQLLLGYDTETSIRSGALFGMAAELDGMIDAYRKQYGEVNAVLTGGDLPYFEGRLKNKIFAHPDLCLTGLDLILRYNVPQAH